MRRRTFIRQMAGTLSVGAVGAACTSSPAQPASESGAGELSADAIGALEPMTAGIVPITDGERRSRVATAQRLMAENRIDAIFLEGGSSLYYYTGVRWGTSERLFGVVIPARGTPAWVAPAFEEHRAREMMGRSEEVRVWQEDESPYRLVAQIIRDRGAALGRIGVEERVRFFIYDGVRAELPGAGFVSATPVTAGCRMIKSAAEIALMQRANDITARAMDVALKTMREGMTPRDLATHLAAATSRLGGEDEGALVAFGLATAFPHGSTEPQTLREGDVVLVDAGCKVEGYTSDITRTTVFGTPSRRQRDVWEIEKRAQSAALAAAQPGATCESVDAAARKVITDAGFGPGYALPGLPHRTGHGIGLDGHEWTNFVRGNTTRLQAGMCFSDEPTIAIYGEFGIRLEDCLHMTEDGPVLFTKQGPSIEEPFV